MKKIIIGLYLCLIFSISYSQSYLGWTTQQANLRTSPDKSSSSQKLLKAGAQIFIISTEASNEYYNVIDIETNTEGYVHKSYVKFGDIVEENKEGVFSPNGKSSSYNSEVEVFNNTNLTLSLKLNETNYSFSPKETKTFTVIPGTYSYRASAPGVIPNFGSEYFQNNMNYTWQFYIVTTFR